MVEALNIGYAPTVKFWPKRIDNVFFFVHFVFVIYFLFCVRERKKYSYKTNFTVLKSFELKLDHTNWWNNFHSHEKDSFLKPL